MNKFLVFWYDGRKSRASVVEDPTPNIPRLPFMSDETLEWLRSEICVEGEEMDINGVVGPLPMDCEGMTVVVDGDVVQLEGFDNPLEEDG